MVALDGDHMCLHAYRQVGWPGTPDIAWLRAGAAERLQIAAEQLPIGFGFAVFDSWRSIETIRALYSHFYGPGSVLEPGFLADPDAPGLVPPHLTGGAIDLTLTWEGTPLSLGTPFDEFSDRAHLQALEPDPEPSEPDRSLRRLLYQAMTGAGFAPFNQEWWHYSWGDAAWALWSGEPAAQYGAVTPEKSD